MSAKFPMPFGAYALLKALGSGAMGDVCLARPYNDKRGIPTPVVIKRLHGELGTNPDFVRRFQHEAEIAVSVDSPHVAKVYDVGGVGDTLYIAMEFVGGWPLSKFIESVIASGRHASVGAIIDLVAGGLEGLYALHTAKDIRTGKPLGVVHRDISPKNLMLGEDGKMRLIDLGLGKSNVQDWKTATGVVMGSVGYMPPEQVTAEKVDQRADIYSMAVVLFELLALRHYIPRGPIPIMLRNSVAPNFEPPSRFRPDIPTGLDDVLRKALAHSPDDRHTTAAELLADIRRVVPDRKTAGGMANLVNELFGVQLKERHAEMMQLLSLPLPQLDEDEPEPEPTVTYVMAQGVAPIGENDGPQVRRVDHPNDVAPPPAWTPDRPLTHIAGMVPRSPDEMPAPSAEAMFTGYPNSSLHAPPSKGVSLPVLMLAIVAALGAGAAIMMFVGPGATDRETVTVLGLPSSPTPTATPAPTAPTVVAAVGAASAPPDAGMAPAASPQPTHQPVRRPQNTAAPSPSAPPAETAQPTPTPAKVEITPESVQALNKRLMDRTKAAIETADADTKSKLNGVLTKLSMEMGSSDFEKSHKALKRLEAELSAIAP